MGLSYAMRVKRFAKAKAESLPLSLAQNHVQHPNAVRHFKHQLPTLAHGETIRFGWNISSSLAYAKKMWKPNYFVRPLFSERLGMYIYCRVSERANAEVIRAGGLDSYLLAHPGMLDTLGTMYREKVIDSVSQQRNEPNFDILREKYGDLYVNALKSAHDKNLADLIARN